MSKLIALILLVGLVGTAAAYDLGNREPVKPVPAAPDFAPQTKRQGGDTLAAAVEIGSLPFSDSGTTCGYADDYDETCPYLDSTSPDVVYRYTPQSEIVIDIDLCESTYDTKLYVYDAELTLVACNDDFHADPPCGAYVSFLSGVHLSAGATYYFVVDGYAGDCGQYSLSVTETIICLIPCPPEREGEPPLVIDYLDAYNGGCNSQQFGTPFQQIVGEIQPGGVCVAEFCAMSGWYTYNGANYRDTDWFTFDIGPTGSTFVSVDTGYPVYVFHLGPQDCNTTIPINMITPVSCQPAGMTITGAPGSSVWLWVGPTTFVSPNGPGVDQFLYKVYVYGLASANPGPAICSDFQDQTTQGWAFDWASGSTNQPGPSGSPTDYYLEVVDQLGSTSSIIAPGSYGGDWRNLHSHHWATLEWDVKLIDDGGVTTPVVPLIGIASGTNPGMSAIFYASGYQITEQSGWRHVIAPLADSHGSGPPQGWVLSPQATWPALLANIGRVWLPAEIASQTPAVIGYDNICIIDRASDTSTGLYKQLENTTNLPANDVEIVLEGAYPSVKSYSSALFPPRFDTFAVTVLPDGNTSLRWSDPPASVVPGGFCTIGFNVPGTSVNILSINWSYDGVNLGCAYQTQLKFFWGTAGSQVLFENSVRYFNCLYEAHIWAQLLAVEWHESEVPPDQLDFTTDRRPMRRDLISGALTGLAPGEIVSFDAPAPPDGARWAVVLAKVGADSSLSEPGVTLDVVQFKLLNESTTGVPDPEETPEPDAVSQDQYDLRIRSNPLRTQDVEIQFELARSDDVMIDMYDVRGKRVRSLPAQSLAQGAHALSWDARGQDGQRLASGVYFVRVGFARNGDHRVKRLVVLR